MREIDIIAKEKFDGDIKKTIEYLLLNLGPGEFDKYVRQLNADESKFALTIIKRETVKAVGGQSNFEVLMRNQDIVSELNMSFDEVNNAKKNPYKAKILKSILGMLLVEGGILTMGLLGVPVATLGLASAVGISVSSSFITDNIMKYFKFKKLKKAVDNVPVQEEESREMKGRGM